MQAQDPLAVIDPALIKQAVVALKNGDLVAIPTETVYGLAADASNPTAVKKIFTAKGRPADHPLIVHVAAPSANDDSAAQEAAWFNLLTPWVRDLSEDAMRLILAFWPGPLTLVFKKDKHVLSEVTGGQDTVAIRSPSHPIAQALLRELGGGLAAPSANRFGKVSPTRAADVRSEFDDLPALLVLDGGDCEVGIESTIVDMTSNPPVLLRPGAITPNQIQSRTGITVVGLDQRSNSGEDGVRPRVSGSLKAHYAPNTPMRMYAPGGLHDCLAEYPDIKSRVAVVMWESERAIGGQSNHMEWHEIAVPLSSEAFASGLYRLLRDLDDQAWDLILIPEPPTGQEWDGVRDRLQRACFGSGPSESNHVKS